MSRCREKFALKTLAKPSSVVICYMNEKLSLEMDKSARPMMAHGMLRRKRWRACITTLMVLFGLVWVSLTWPGSQVEAAVEGAVERAAAVAYSEFNATELESLYQGVLSSSNHAGEWLKKYTSEAHLAGTNFALAQFTADKLEEFGWKAEIENFNVYINYPHDHGIRLLKPHKDSYRVVYEPTLVEDELEEDPTTRGDGLVPAFHGYSANGNVTGELVFANYGTKQDFELLAERGVTVKGKVVIVRYGGIFSGLKVKFAQEAGAVGVIIYSDPADDYTPSGVEPYPKGPGRNPSSIQRGSVQFLSSLPGDPARFTDRSPEALANLTTIPRIPSLPISYKEAIPILETLNGHGLDLGFKGGLSEFNYSTGPSTFQVNLYNDVTYNFTDISNVYGFVEGEDADKVIIIGNHRDAWIKGGASDPNSGSAVLLEVARAFGELFKLGYKPRYSLLLASWDGEEYGLLGSTAYAEKYADQLKKNVIAYLNVDVAVSGSHLRLTGSPLLEQFVLNQTKKLSYPGDETLSLYDHFVNESSVHILGSGSDYTAFYEHLGIPSFDLGFVNGKSDPVYHYHSNYDSYHWMSKFADPGFKYHNALAKYIGLLAINLSEPKLLQSLSPLDFAHSLKGFYEALVEQVPPDWLNKTIELENGDEDYLMNSCHLRVAQITKKHKKKPTLKKWIKATRGLIHAFIGVAKGHEAKKKELQEKWDTDVSKSKNPLKKFLFNRRVRQANDQSSKVEQQFLYAPGLKNRDWFKHIVFASGRYTGYAGQALPGLAEALEDNDFEEAVRWIGIIREAAKQGLVSLVK